MLYRFTFVVLFASFQALADGPLLKVAGSNTVGAKLAPECAKGYIQDILGANSAVRVETGIENAFVIIGDNNKHIAFAAHGSSTGFKGLLNNTADIALASRPIKNKELSALAAKGDMTAASAEHAVAIDGLAIVVNPANTITQLQLSKLSKIFSGEITNWAQLGGDDAKINLYARDNNSGTFDTFKSLILKKSTLAATAKRFESNALLSASVASDVNGIGFTSLASVGVNTALAIADEDTAFLSPTYLNVASEDYLLSRRLYMYVPPTSSNNHARAFVEYCQSQHGQQIAKNVGFVSQNIVAVDTQAPASSPAQYQQLATMAERLSVNFRFAKASADLDNKAKRDAQRLLQYYEANKNDIELVLVGFSDAKSRASTATILSKLRTLVVKDALREKGIPVAQWHALGANMPVSANGKGNSAVKNGRVEVWVKPREPALALLN